MYKVTSLESFKTLWNKDEETFQFCLDLLKDKITLLEYYQLNFYFYLQNDLFEKAMEYWYKLKSNISLMDDDFWHEVEKYETTRDLIDYTGSSCGSCCSDCNIGSTICTCLLTGLGCGMLLSCCSSVGFSWNGGDWRCTNNCC